MHHTLISLATLPTLAVIFAARSLSLGTLTIGRWSEELLRGDRLPVQDPSSPETSNLLNRSIAESERLE